MDGVPWTMETPVTAIYRVDFCYIFLWNEKEGQCCTFGATVGVVVVLKESFS